MLPLPLPPLSLPLMPGQPLLDLYPHLVDKQRELNLEGVSGEVLPPFVF